MSMLKNLAPFSCFMVIAALIVGNTCNAQNSPKDYVDAHNIARAAVGVGNIKWNEQLAANALLYANQLKESCALITPNFKTEGPVAAGDSALLTGKYAVDLWVEAKVYYDYKTNTCATGKVCTNYLQVVWRNSVLVGCARVQCNDVDGWSLVTCQYDPPGLVEGERPY